MKIIVYIGIVTFITCGSIGCADKCYEFMNKQDYDGAIKECSEDLNKYHFASLKVHAYTCRGIAYANKGLYDLAIADFNSAITLDPKFNPAFINRGITYSRNKDYDLALDDFNKAVLQSPTESELFNARGNVYLRTARYDQASKDFMKAIDLNPKNASPYYNMACLASLNNNIEEACRWFSKTIELGFNKWDLIKNDSDLENIRNKACYQEVMANK